MANTVRLSDERLMIQAFAATVLDVHINDIANYDEAVEVLEQVFSGNIIPCVAAVRAMWPGVFGPEPSTSAVLAAQDFAFRHLTRLGNPLPNNLQSRIRERREEFSTNGFVSVKNVRNAILPPHNS